MYLDEEEEMQRELSQIVNDLKENGIFLLNSPYGAENLDKFLPQNSSNNNGNKSKVEKIGLICSTW